MDRLGVALEVLRMAWQRRPWVLFPPVIVLLIVAALILIVEITPASPFLYPLF